MFGMVFLQGRGEVGDRIRMSHPLLQQVLGVTKGATGNWKKTRKNQLLFYWISRLHIFPPAGKGSCGADVVFALLLQQYFNICQSCKNSIISCHKSSFFLWQMQCMYQIGYPVFYMIVDNEKYSSTLIIINNVLVGTRKKGIEMMRKLHASNLQE